MTTVSCCTATPILKVTVITTASTAFTPADPSPARASDNAVAFQFNTTGLHRIVVPRSV